jgi:hypothetical protein
MRLKTRAHRFGSTQQSRPSTGMSPPMVPVDGDDPPPLAQNSVEELICAMARLFTPSERSAGDLKPVTVGGFVVLDPTWSQYETDSPPSVARCYANEIGRPRRSDTGQLSRRTPARDERDVRDGFDVGISGP